MLDGLEKSSNIIVVIHITRALYQMLIAGRLGELGKRAAQGKLSKRLIVYKLLNTISFQLWQNNHLWRC